MKELLEINKKIYNILNKYPGVLEILLIDRSTSKNIIWATKSYEDYGKNYEFSAQILQHLIKFEDTFLITPRIRKKNLIKENRVRDRGEVYTPSWICNYQNNFETKQK